MLVGDFSSSLQGSLQRVLEHAHAMAAATHESSQRERKWEAALSFWLTFGRHTASFLSDLIDYTNQPYLMLEGATPGCESQEERLSRANLETGGHNSQH